METNYWSIRQKEYSMLSALLNQNRLIANCWKTSCLCMFQVHTSKTSVDYSVSLMNRGIESKYTDQGFFGKDQKKFK